MFEKAENRCLDIYVETGNDYEGFKAATKRLEKDFVREKYNSADIELLSFHSRTTNPTKARDANGEVILKADGTPKMVIAPVVASVCLKPNHLITNQFKTPLEDLVGEPRKGSQIATTIKAYPESRIPTPELLKEWTEDIKLAFIINDNETSEAQFYYASANALQTMDRFGMAGDFLTEPCLERDVIIAKRFEKDLGITLIVKKCGKVKKIFSILSDKYTHIDQSIFFDIIKAIEKDGEMGPAVCYKWSVTNFLTQLYVEFPQKAEEFTKLYGLKREMIPGLLMTTSGTGDSSFRVRGTWRVKGTDSLIFNSEVKRKHIGEIKKEDILEDVTNHIFAEYAKLPEALCNLMAHDVTDPKWDLTSTAGIKANQAEIENVLKTAFKRLGIVKAIGKKTEKKLRDAVLRDFSPDIPYTAYDFAMEIMGLPERVTIEEKGKDISQLQKACGNAPFIKYDADTSVIVTD